MDDDLLNSRHDDDTDDEDFLPKKKRGHSYLDPDLEEHVDKDESLSAEEMAEEEEDSLYDSYDDVEPEDLM